MKNNIKRRIARLLVAGLMLGTLGIQAGFSSAETTGGSGDTTLYPAAASPSPTSSARASGSPGPTASASAKPTASNRPSPTPLSELEPVIYISDKEAKDAASFNEKDSKTDGWFTTNEIKKYIYLNYRVETNVSAYDNVTLELEVVNSSGKTANFDNTVVDFTGQYYSRSLSIKYGTKEEETYEVKLKTYIGGTLDHTWTGKYTLYKPMTATLDGQNEAVRYAKSGTEYELRAVADGGHAAKRTYQWYSVNTAEGETLVQGANSSTLKVPANAQNDLLDFRCKVSDGIGEATTGKIGVREIFSITYNPGYEGKTIPDGEKKYGEEYTILGPGFERDGYDFECWTGSDGKTYYQGDKYAGNANLVLTAQWKGTQDVKASIKMSSVIYGKTVSVSIRNLGGRAVSLESSNPRVLKIVGGRQVKVVGFGKANITVRASENSQYNESSYTIRNVTVIPPKMSGIRIKKESNGNYTLQWKNLRKQSITGSINIIYHVNIGTDKPTKKNSMEIPGRYKGKKVSLWMVCKNGKGNYTQGAKVTKKLL